MSTRSMTTSYDDWISSVRGHGYESTFTRKEWIDWWTATGEWDNRGSRKGNVCMWRIDKEQPFSADNVELRVIKKKMGAK